VCAGTLARWRETDWGEEPVVVTDDGAGPPSSARHLATARRMLAAALDHPADYSLVLADDLLFNLHLRHNLITWPPLCGRALWMGSLFNPRLTLVAPPGGTVWGSRSAWIAPVAGGYSGAQAIVLSRPALEAAMREWDSVPGSPDHRLVAIALRYSPAVALHRPSLVQRLPVPSIWDGPSHRAVDFDPFYRADG
jgi:hypothetical protein